MRKWDSAPFRPFEPIGSRATGGVEVDFAVVPECRPEMDDLHQNRLDPALPPAQQTVLWGRLCDLVQLARAGKLSFEGRPPQAKVMERRWGVYELRPLAPRGSLLKRELRLYCGEPHTAIGVILGLHLATKPGLTEDVDGEQNAAIDLAGDRADQWVMDRDRANAAGSNPAGLF